MSALATFRRWITRAADWQRPEGWSIVNGSQPTEYKATGKNVRVLGWERHPIVNACARVIVDQVAAVPLEFYKLKADGDTDVLSMHPALDVVESPLPTLSGLRLRGLLALHYVLYGNAFALILRDGRKRPAGLKPIHPERIQFVHVDAATDTILQWDWTDTQGTAHQTPWEDMIHIPDLTASEDALFGFPRAAAALIAISSDHEASQYVRQMVTNSGAPGLAVMTEGGATSLDMLKEAEESWHNAFVTRGQRGRVKFMSGIKDIKVLGFNLQQLEFPDLRAIAREDICAAFGVDPRMVSVSSAANDGGLSGVQYEEARRRLEHQTCKPIRAAIVAGLDLSFTPEFGLVYCRFSPTAIAELTEDKEANHKRAREDMTAGGITREEFRAETGRPEEMDPSHTLVGSVSRLEYPVSMAVKKTEQQTAPPEPPDDSEFENEDSAGANERKSLPPNALIPNSGLTPVVRRGMALTDEHRAALWQAFDTRATKLEASYERTALVLFAAEAQGVAATFAAVMLPGRARALIAAGYGGNGNGVARRESPDDPFVLEALRRINEDYAPGGAYHEAWLARYLALIGETVRVAGADIATATGLDFTIENPRVRAIIRRRAAALVQSVTDTTRESIRAAIEAGRAQGMGIQQIATLIQQTTFGEITKSRAMTIARTETVGALNAGEFSAAVESGVLRSKEWLSQGDGRVRDSHRAIDGQRVDIGAAFSNGLQHPHAEGAPAREVVNCRCTVLYHDEEAPA